MSPPLDPANPLLISKELLGSQEVSFYDDDEDDDGDDDGEKVLYMAVICCSSLYNSFRQFSFPS